MTLQAEKKEFIASPSGNRTPVSRVTGGDTHHYTNEELHEQASSDSSLISFDPAPSQPTFIYMPDISSIAIAILIEVEWN